MFRLLAQSIQDFFRTKFKSDTENTFTQKNEVEIDWEAIPSV